jgi:hypothetical protein
MKRLLGLCVFCVVSASIVGCGAHPPMRSNGKECDAIDDVKYKIDRKSSTAYLLLRLADGQTVVVTSKNREPGPHAASAPGGSGSAASTPLPPPPSVTDLFALPDCPCAEDLCAPMCGVNLQAFACRATGP